MRKWALILGLLVVGCEVKAAEDPSAKLAREKAASEEYRRKSQAESEERWKTRQAEALKAQDERLRGWHQQTEQDKAQHAEDRETMCAETRAERVAEMEKRMASIQHKRELVTWEADHCHWVDNSKSVVRVFQDSEGRFYAAEGPDRQLDRVCDGAPPAEIKEHYARFVQVYSVPPGRVHDSIMLCGASDRSNPETATLATAYLKEQCIGWGRNGKTPPAACAQFRE